jgi:hypothetical protein
MDILSTPVSAMPSTVTAFSVKIASPGDAGIELTIARDVLGEWNARHTLEQKRILLPLDAEDAPASSASDMMVAFFCGKIGTRGSETEIEQHLQTGKPALVYFSEGRSDLIGARLSPGPALEDFKKRYAAAVVDSYGDEKELRATFARQLDATMSSHPHFQVGTSSSSFCSCLSSAAVPDAPTEPHVTSTGALSSHAITILSEACDDFEAYIGRMKVGNMLRIQANGKQLVEPNTPESVALWDNAFNELLTRGFIIDAGCNGQLFQISASGFGFLKSMGKTPVGYIAELGGM